MATASASFTTAWVPPTALEVSVTIVEELSHIQLDWTASELAIADFSHYGVYRRDFGASVWTLLSSITAKTTTQFKDPSAGQGVLYEYQVVNFRAIPGDSPLGSEENDTLPASLESDVWFVIGNLDPEDDANAFELPVAGEQHTRPIQQEVFEPIVGNRKKVARGNTLGFEGSLEVSWLSEERVTAKRHLEFLSTVAGPHFLKSPFGDVWRVEFDSPDYKYSGGGHLVVEIGWVEVS